MKRRSEEQNIGMDSFLDIVTNVIGLMILIAAAIVLNAQQISVSMGSPMLRDAPDGALAIYFNCDNNRIVPRHDVVMMTKNVLSQHYKTREQAPSFEEAVQWLNAQELGNEFYSYSYEADGNDLLAILTPREMEQGETADDLRKGDSDFEWSVESLDPSESYVYFIVREDSFAVFRQARRVAREHGLSVGWQPLSSPYPFKHVIFGGHWGRGDQVQ